jgi:hypothetical protein
VTPALIAKLFELEAIRSLLLVLGRNVIPVLALGALKRNVVSWHNSSTRVRQTFQFVASEPHDKLKFVGLIVELLDNLGDRSSAHRSPAFPDRKPQSLLHRDRRYQLDHQP